MKSFARFSPVWPGGEFLCGFSFLLGPSFVPRGFYWGYPRLPNFHLICNSGTHMLGDPGQIVGTIQCSSRSYSKLSPRTLYCPDYLPLGLRGWGTHEHLRTSSRLFKFHFFLLTVSYTSSRERLREFSGKMISKRKMLWSFIKFSQLTLKGNVLRSGWTVCMWITAFSKIQLLVYYQCCVLRSDWLSYY